LILTLPSCAEDDAGFTATIEPTAPSPVVTDTVSTPPSSTVPPIAINSTDTQSTRTSIAVGPVERVSIRLPVGSIAVSADDVFVVHDDGEIAVSVGDDTTTRVRFFHNASFTEVAALEQTLPASARSVRLHSDGRTLLWVDQVSDAEAVLQLLLPDSTTPETLGDGYRDAWFARSS
jgi:hypothetical protein